MNFNPFIFTYTKYPNSKLATFLNSVLSGMQRIFIVFSVLIAFVAIIDDISNKGEALIAAAIMFILWLLIKLNKDKWANKIAAKQERIDNQNKK